MPNPSPDPNGRPSAAKPAPAAASADAPASGEENRPAAASPLGSTGSHHPAASSSELSDLIHSSGSARRVATGSDILQMLANPGASPIVSGSPANTDDAPTIITRPHGPAMPPLALPVSGDPPSLAGRRLGHFELIESIGAGGMAAVLKARDLELGRVVALKILPPEAARDPESVNRFKQEGRAAAMLDHENVARVYFCGEDQGLHFIAFEFVEGENLRALIDRRGTLPPAECVRYMIQVAAGLNHAADRGVVHRDIKPSNILITPDGRAKIVDMGLARHLDSLAVNGGVTQSGVTLGTFDYISPEQALDPRRADVRSDIYSLGCAFYHALTGRPPVPEGTAAKKLHAHQHIEPLDPRQLNPAVPDELAAVLAGMMAKNPDQRYQTPSDLIAHLKAVAERLKLSPEAVTPDSAVQAVPASPSVLPEPPRMRLGWVIAAAAVAIAIAAFALSPGDSGRRQPPPWANESSHKATGEVGLHPGPQPPPGHPATDGVVVVRTAADLAEALANPRTTLVHLEPGTYDLSALSEGIAFTGKELELVGPPTGSAKVLLTAHNPRANGRPRGSLAIRADSVTVRGVRFEVHDDAFQGELFDFEEFPTHPVGLTIQAGVKVHLLDCVFASLVPADEEAVAVAVTSSNAQPVTLNVDRCVFGHAGDALRGGVALQVPARSDVTIDDSGFGPHAVAVQAVAKDETPEVSPAPARVKLYRSSFMLEPKCAVVSTAVPTDVQAGYCVFAPVGVVPVEPFADPFGAVVQAVGKVEGVKFAGVAGQKNAYYRVTPAGDREAVILARRPWDKERPLDVLAGAEPWPAFALDPTEPRLSLADRERAIVGAQFHARGSSARRAYSSDRVPVWPPSNLPKSPLTPEERQLVWHPKAQDDPLPRNTYTSLAALLRVAKSGDTVLIRHDGLLEGFDAAVELKARGGAADFKVTFRPFPGSKPILAPHPTDPNPDQTLFKLLGGEVAFENLQFLLKPSRPRNQQTVAAVSIVGGKACTFTNCVFTLAEEDEGRAAVVLVADPPDKGMAMDGAARPTPDVKFERCVIRGKGRGVWVPASRAVRVDANQTLTAIDGPLFLAEPTGKAGAAARSYVKLTRVTALVGGPVVQLHAGKTGEMMRTGGLVPVDVEADECLFAAVPGAGMPLVEFDGVDAADAKTALTWQVRKANRYANFDDKAAVAVIRPGAEGSTPKEWHWDLWISFAGEPPTTGQPVGKVMFENGPTSLRDLATLGPADAAVQGVDFPELTDAKSTDAGADTKALPEPWEE